MSDLLFDAEDDACTPLTPEEREQLIPTYITTRAQLNEAEQANITGAVFWAFGRKRDVLGPDFLLTLHKRMLKDVWQWAGQFRETELHQLLGDVRCWIEFKSYPADEIAVRFHHRLVFIHPFPNGNGRHARLAADLLAVQLGLNRLSWGSGNLVAVDELRARYVAALWAADNHDISALLDFARS